MNTSTLTRKITGRTAAPSKRLRAAVKAVGLARAGFGVWLVADPARTGRAWFGSPPERPETAALLRSVGVRDVAIGAGAAAAARPGPWLRAGAAADVVDGAALLAASSGLPRRKVVSGAAVAFGFAAIGWALDRATRS